MHLNPRWDKRQIGGGEAETAAAAGLTLSAESSRESKKRRVSTEEDEASNALLDPPAIATAASAAVTYKSVISGMVIANKSNSITEENYYLLQWLYRIRNASCRRGLRISHLQPDFLWGIYRSMMRSKKSLKRTDGDIKVAVDLWCFNRAAAEHRYGHISEWDVSSVTDMSKLFEGKDKYDEM